MWFPSVYPEFIVVYPTSANQEIVEARNFCSEQESLVISKSHKKERRWRDQVYIYMTPIKASHAAPV